MEKYIDKCVLKNVKDIIIALEKADRLYPIEEGWDHEATIMHSNPDGKTLSLEVDVVKKKELKRSK